MTLIRITWQEYLSLSKNIISHLEEHNYIPDLVVGIARGGLTPMVTISKHFRIREVGVIFMQKTASEENFAEMLPQARYLGYGIPFEVESKSVLLVDNIIQSGQTVREAMKTIAHLKASSIKVVSICIHKGIYDFNPYAAMQVDQNDWVEFPWD